MDDLGAKQKSTWKQEPVDRVLFVIQTQRH